MAITAARKAVQSKNAAQAAFAKLSEEDQKAIVDSILDYPEGCEDGKRTYIEKVGLPIPPIMIATSVSIKIAADSTFFIRDTRYPATYNYFKVSNDAFVKINEALAPLGMKVAQANGGPYTIDKKYRPAASAKKAPVAKKATSRTTKRAR